MAMAILPASVICAHAHKADDHTRTHQYINNHVHTLPTQIPAPLKDVLNDYCPVVPRPPGDAVPDRHNQSHKAVQEHIAHTRVPHKPVPANNQGALTSADHIQYDSGCTHLLIYLPEKYEICKSAPAAMHFAFALYELYSSQGFEASYTTASKAVKSPYFPVAKLTRRQGHAVWVDADK